MNKILLVLIILSLYIGMNAIEVKCYKIESKTCMYLFIPFEQFIVPGSGVNVQYQLSVNLINSEKKSVYQNIFNIDLDKQDVIIGAAYVKEIDLELNPGKYVLINQFRNKLLGDKKELRSDVVVPDTNDKLQPFIIVDNGKYMFCPSSYQQLHAGLKKCYFFTGNKPECDSIVIKYDFNNSEKRIRLHPELNIRTDILSYLPEGEISNPEILYFTGNIINKVKLPLYRSNNLYLETYSPKEQMQQIKYIANQNEWKVLRKVADRELQDYIDKFWEMHNKHPGSSDNETQEIFYARVLKADELFTTHKKLHGWKSDRGRIYIIYGQPDDAVEGNVTISNNIGDRTYPYLKWSYYKINKEFYFIDKSGYGNFKIVDEYYEN